MRFPFGLGMDGLFNQIPLLRLLIVPAIPFIQLQRVVPFGGLLLFFCPVPGRCSQSQRALFLAFQRAPSPTHRHCGDCSELRLQHFVEAYWRRIVACGGLSPAQS